MVFGGLILQARPRASTSLVSLRIAARVWQVCYEPSPMCSQLHPLAFLKGPMSQGPGKLPQCSLPTSCLGEMGKPLLGLCEMHGSPCGCHPVGASFLFEWQFRKGKVPLTGSLKESLYLSEFRTLRGSL